jgi:hypothetical protein
VGYSSRTGRRPAENASKAAHDHVVRDAAVQAFLARCDMPKQAGDVRIPDDRLLKFEPVADNPVRHVIAVDGGYTEVAVRKEFPSAPVCFFQFGALVFSVADLEQLAEQPFIDPDDMARWKRIQRLKLVLPVRNVALAAEGTLGRSVRRAVFDFFHQSMEGGRLIDTLRWFLFREYAVPAPSWVLASCPPCDGRGIPLERARMARDHTFPCPKCGGESSSRTSFGSTRWWTTSWGPAASSAT